MFTAMKSLRNISEKILKLKPSPARKDLTINSFHKEMVMLSLTIPSMEALLLTQTLLLEPFFQFGRLLPTNSLERNLEARSMR